MSRYQIAFKNDNPEKNIESEGLKHLEMRKQDIEKYFNDPEVYEEGNGDLPPFNEYGLSFDFVDAGTFDDQKIGYYRYQFSWGGPSEELRIYRRRIIFVYLDWFSGIGFHVSEDEAFKNLVQDFKDMGVIDWDNLDPKQIHI